MRLLILFFIAIFVLSNCNTEKRNQVVGKYCYKTKSNYKYKYTYYFKKDNTYDYMLKEYARGRKFQSNGIYTKKGDTVFLSHFPTRTVNFIDRQLNLPELSTFSIKIISKKEGVSKNDSNFKYTIRVNDSINHHFFYPDDSIFKIDYKPKTIQFFIHTLPNINSQLILIKENNIEIEIPELNKLNYTSQFNVTNNNRCSFSNDDNDIGIYRDSCLISDTIIFNNNFKFRFTNNFKNYSFKRRF